MEIALNGRRKMNDWQEQYGTARTANNLAAVHICTGDLEAALAACQEAESKLIDMLQEGIPHPEPLTFAGLAMVRYNAAVLFWTAGDFLLHEAGQGGVVP
ncbi:tetratricopeptide repeat protein [Micromonospora trifolii]|uniref:tetratricopeptide repeat protein n=1 Tax=Micromonospora trifolii TaxID=2911208 RepID=UPI003D2F1D7C